MIKLNRTTEYGLMALRHMSRKHSANSTAPVEMTSAREIADSYGLPFDITAKTLQKLKETGIIHSVHGAKGGYTLHRSLDTISLAEFLELMEGPQSLVMCTGSTGSSENHSSQCEYGRSCEIRGFVSELNARVFDFLSAIRLTDLAERRSAK